MERHDCSADDVVLVTGATGYVGGRLVPRLLEAGFRVRCLVRDPSRLQGRSWLPCVEVVQGDVLDPSSLAAAVEGVHTAYYLVHSLAEGAAYQDRDVRAARNFATALRDAGGHRIIYLGGLGDSATALSPHLRSRQATGHALREAGLPVTELRAAVIVGSGSLSFEIVRYIAERLPVMICPKWVYTCTQPIAMRDALTYLVAALRSPCAENEIVEIGGASVLSYAAMILGYARIRGLRRVLIPVPALSPRISAFWVHLITPVPAHIAQPLIEGLRNEVVLHDDLARRRFPEIVPMDYETAVRRALYRLETGGVETAWSDALSTTHPAAAPVVLTSGEGLVREQRQAHVAATPAEVFRTFASLGGRRGWLYMNWAWQLRGRLDRVLGGVGMRRGRRNDDLLRTGDALDFWRVESVIPDRLLRLRAEMKVPGRAWLEFQVTPDSSNPDGGVLLSQTALFAPKGLGGWLYWYALYPVHARIFSGMIRAIAERAVRTPRTARGAA